MRLTLHTFIPRILFLFLFIWMGNNAFSQTDSAAILRGKPVLPQDSGHVPKIDTPLKHFDPALRTHSPRKAALRSAIIPGWGQIYNKKYWKVPIVYTALGVTGYIFFDNLKTYREYRFAYTARYKAAQPPPFRDSTDYFKLKSIYKRVSPEAIRTARNKFRQYIDYSTLFFIVFWGLNVVDATVDAHLKSFDVSPDLGLRIVPGRSEMAGTNGISLILAFKNKPVKLPTFN
jgi:hypothetical protein